jgi:hypothetical protein
MIPSSTITTATTRAPLTTPIPKRSPAFRVSGSILVLLLPLNESTAVEAPMLNADLRRLQARGILAREPIEDGQALEVSRVREQFDHQQKHPSVRFAVAPSSPNGLNPPLWVRNLRLSIS